MYAIQVNSKFWLVATRNGWLMLFQSVVKAMLYETRNSAEATANLHSSMSLKNQFVVQEISTVSDSTLSTFK